MRQLRLPILTIIIVLVHGRKFKMEHPDRSTSKAFYCYSCMNMMFKENWNQLKNIYYPPKNFTDDCLPLPEHKKLGIQPCSHSVCVTIIEPRYLAGHRIGSNVIRGCYSGVYRHPMDRRFLKVVDTGLGSSFCVSTSARKLLPYDMRSVASNRSVQVCSCYGNLCNEFPNSGSQSQTNINKSLSVANRFILYIFLMSVISRVINFDLES